MGLAVHKETIAVAVAYPGRSALEERGEIRNTPKAIGKLRRLSPDGELIAFCYEAGPCGYGIQQQITAFHLQRKASKASEAVQAISWKAQRRLCQRYRHLLAKGKIKQQVTTAIARELSGFIWAIVCEVMDKTNARATRA